MGLNVTNACFLGRIYKHIADEQAMTHPDIAALVDPLFGFAGKRVGEFLFFILDLFLKSPLSTAGEERDGERSNARVSQFFARKT
jgi:hypothetical protein